MNLKGNYTRAEIRLETKDDIFRFLTGFSSLSRAAWPDTFVLTNEAGELAVSPLSMLGLLYATSEWQRLFVVNTTRNGDFPPFIDAFRPA